MHVLFCSYFLQINIWYIYVKYSISYIMLSFAASIQSYKHDINSCNTKAKHTFIFLLQKEEMRHKVIELSISKSTCVVTCLYLICLCCL